MKPEELLVNQVSEYLLDNHPKIPFRFDQIDQVGARGGSNNKRIHGKWSRGYPDLFIATKRGGFGGLFIELKATDNVPNTAHTREQANYHAVLRYNGYQVHFACGFKEAKKLIKKYLKIK